MNDLLIWMDISTWDINDLYEIKLFLPHPQVYQYSWLMTNVYWDYYVKVYTIFIKTHITFQKPNQISSWQKNTI